MRRSLFRYAGYALSCENYALLWRAIAAAWRLRSLLPDSRAETPLLPAIEAARGFRLDRQPGWTISSPEKIVLFAAWVARQPPVSGLCVQQSLIAWRLLNGYGIPARICFGISRESPATSGHAWVEALRPADRKRLPLFDSSPFQLVYASDQDQDPQRKE